MLVVGTNSAATRMTNLSVSAGLSLNDAMAKLSSGKRIGKAADDAANIGISQSMTAQIRGMTQAMRNVNDGIALTQTADGALGNVTTALQRIRELAVQTSSGTYTDKQRTDMQAEVSQLNSQISDILTTTEYNGVRLFDTASGGSGKDIKIQTGASSSDTITLSIANIQVSGFSIADRSSASNTMTAADTMIGKIVSARSGLGAAQSRLQSAANTLSNSIVNLSSARSQIQDTDFSSQTSVLAREQMLNQAATAMLAQANQNQQGVLQLLR